MERTALQHVQVFGFGARKGRLPPRDKQITLALSDENKREQLRGHL